MIDTGKLPKGHCGYCGKEIPVRDIRDRKARFCDRTHASMARFATRYQGTMAGPVDKPDLEKKMSEL